MGVRRHYHKRIHPQWFVLMAVIQAFSHNLARLCGDKHRQPFNDGKCQIINCGSFLYLARLHDAFPSAQDDKIVAVSAENRYPQNVWEKRTGSRRERGTRSEPALSEAEVRTAPANRIFRYGKNNF